MGIETDWHGTRMRVAMMLAVLLLAAATAVGGGSATAARQTAKTSRQLSPLDSARMFFRMKNYGRCRGHLMFIVHDERSNIEAEALLARCHEELRDGPRAAVMYKMCARSIRESSEAFQAKYARMLKQCERKIARLDKRGPEWEKAYAESAAHKEFESAETVGDLWMTQVKVDKLPLRMLEHPGACITFSTKRGWPLDWSTCTIRKPAGAKGDPTGESRRLTGPQLFPERHSSGAAVEPEAGGRKGILLAGPDWRERLPTQWRIRNSGKCNFLRIGASSGIWSMPNCVVPASQDKCDFLLNVYVEGKQIFTKVIGGRQWHDLKIDLGEFRGQDVEVIVENASGGAHPYYEIAYFDYMDFFDN